MTTEQRNKQYCNYVEKRLPKTRYFPSLLYAFLFGGGICALGQGFHDILRLCFPTMSETYISTYVLIILIFLASFLTGLGVFDRLGSIAGAGTIIPITGFSNSIASPAMEFKNEGLIFGLCAKMFVIAGPVIVSGVVSSIIVGAIYLIVGLF